MFDLRALFGRKRPSKTIAKSRLHFVLVQDRSGLTNEEMTGFRKEMLDVIEKFFVIDKSAFDIEYKRSPDTTTLVINSPIIVRRQEGLRHEAGRRGKNKQRHQQPEAEVEAQEAV